MAQNRSRLTWASSGVVAVIVRHHRPHMNFTPHSTAPLRFPRRSGQATPGSGWLTDMSQLIG